MSSKSDVRKQIASIRKRGARLDTDIHNCAVATLEHIQGSRDVTLATELVAAMPRSGRREALIHWYRENAPVRFNVKDEAFKIDKKREQEVDGFEAEREQGRLAGVDVEAGNATPFYDLTPERPPAQYDLEKAVNSFIRVIKKAREQGNLHPDTSQTTIEARVHEALNTALAEG